MGSIRKSGGFTQIELIIALVIVGVLAVIALPAYQSYLTKAKNSQAIRDIGAISSTISRYFTANNAYPPDLSTLLGSAPLDPWGNPYVYTELASGANKNLRRQDKKLNPLNSDYDLFSVGPNGVWQKQITQKDSADDIIRAGNGGFIGLASDF